MGAKNFMHLVGIVEILVGFATLTRWTRVGAYITSVWLVLIAVNLLISGFFDLAIRDVEIAIGAFVLARMTEVKQFSLVAEGPRRAVLRSETAQPARTV
jgi:hypothetical protein